MGYITTVLTARAGAREPRTAHRRRPPSLSIRLGAVSVQLLRHPKGKATAPCWHKLSPMRLGLLRMTFARSARSIPRGCLVDRLRATTPVGSRRQSAGRRTLPQCGLKEKLARTAAAQLNVPPAEIEFAGGRVHARGNPDNSISFARLAATSHWSPGVVADDDQALRETVFWTPPELIRRPKPTKSIRRFATGFIFDFCGVEVDRVTGAVRIENMSPCMTADVFCIPAWLRVRSPAASHRGSVPRFTRSLHTRRTALFSPDLRRLSPAHDH